MTANNYNEFEVTILEDAWKLLTESEILQDILDAENVWLGDIPEEFINRDLVVRLNYVSSQQGAHFHNISDGDIYTVQVDVWSKEPQSSKSKYYLNVSNRIRHVLNEHGFHQLNSQFSDVDEFGSFRDSRRYEVLKRKHKGVK